MRSCIPYHIDQNVTTTTLNWIHRNHLCLFFSYRARISPHRKHTDMKKREKIKANTCTICWRCHYSDTTAILLISCRSFYHLAAAIRCYAFAYRQIDCVGLLPNLLYIVCMCVYISTFIAYTYIFTIYSSTFIHEF